MKILIIGGTKFLGRHLLKAAIERHHAVTLFNRGKSSAEKFENVERISGDRNFDLDKLNGQTWDAAIDTCGYLPQSVKLSVNALKKSVRQYVFVSSLSAYQDFSQPNFAENTRLAKLSEKQLAKLNEFDLKGEINAVALAEIYGGAKVLCEREVEESMPNRALIIRPGLIVGEFDTTDRFTYWVDRAARGGEILAPGNPDRFTQFIDAFDLAKWIVKMIERRANGIFNVTGKPFSLTMRHLLSEIKTVSQSNAKFTWVSDDFLQNEDVRAWTEMPLYLPDSDKDSKGFLSANIDKALRNGLKFRPLSQTITDVLSWNKSRSGAIAAGISDIKERELLRKWRVQYLN